MLTSISRALVGLLALPMALEFVLFEQPPGGKVRAVAFSFMTPESSREEVGLWDLQRGEKVTKTLEKGRVILSRKRTPRR